MSLRPLDLRQCVCIVRCFICQRWQIKLQIGELDYSKDSSKVLWRPLNHFTLHRATYACPTAKVLDPKYTTACFTVQLYILCTVDAQLKFLTTVPWLYLAGNWMPIGWSRYLPSFRKLTLMDVISVIYILVASKVRPDDFRDESETLSH